ncbi:MAG: carboxypeptidase-like regulatory domain-containing protein [Candidatus Omnitrophota bacterium]
MRQLPLFKSLVSLLFLTIIVVLVIIVIQSNPKPAPTTHVRPPAAIAQATPVPDIAPLQNRLRFHAQDEEGAAIAKAAIHILDTSHQIAASAETDALGWAEIQDLPAAQYNISISCPDFFGYSETISLSNDSTANLNAVLYRKKSILGTVQSLDNHPVAEASITILNVSPRAAIDSNLLAHKAVSAASAASGEFALYPLVSGEYILLATHPNYLPHRETTQAGDKIVIRLSQLAQITVTVVDERRDPIGGAPVEIHSTATSLIAAASGNTDTNGQIVFKDMKPGIYSLEAVSPYNENVRAATDVDVSNTDAVDIVLLLTTPHFSLSGRVLNAVSLQGIPNATVVCQRESILSIPPAPEYCITGEQGAFAFHDLTPGNYKLFVEKMAGFISGDFGGFFRFGAQPPLCVSHSLDQDVVGITIYLKPSWFLTGRVLNEKGEGLAETSVSLLISFSPKEAVGFRGSRNTGPDIETITNNDGSFRLEGQFEFDDSTTSVLARANHRQYGGKRSKEVRPHPGETIENLNIQYQNAWNLYGEVRDEEGHKIENAFISVFLPPTGGDMAHVSGRAKTDANGEYFLYADPGTYIAQAEAKGFLDPERISRQVSLPETGQMKVDFVLRKFDGKIEGSVISTKGMPISEVDIYALEKERSEDRSPFIGELVTKTDANGSFSFDPSGLFRPLTDPVYQIAAKPKKTYAQSTVDNIELGQKDVTIVVDEKEDRSFEIFGKVVDEKGAPVNEFDISFAENLAIRRSNGGIAAENDYTKGWFHFQSPDGDFHLAGEYDSDDPITLSAHNPELGLAFSPTFYLQPRETKRHLIIQFKGLLSIQGKLVDKDDGSPVADADVSVLLETSTMEDLDMLKNPGFNVRMARGVQGWLQHYIPKTKSRKDGYFLLDRVPNETLFLTVMKDRYKNVFRRVIGSPSSNRIDLGVIRMPQYISLEDGASIILYQNE